MAEDQCLIQYVRDNFGEEYVHNYNITDVDGDGTYGLDFNTFTESSTFQSSPTADDTNADPFVPVSLFGSPTTCVEAAAMENLYLPSVNFSPNGVGPQVPAVPNNLRVFDSTPDPQISMQNDYPLLAAYGFSQGRPSLPDHLGEFRQGRPPGLLSEISMDEQLQIEQVVQNQSAAKGTLTSTSGISSIDGERRTGTSFWRGKSPALLMEQLKGPSISASSSSSEARSTIRAPSNQNHTLGSRSHLNLTSLPNHYRTVGDVMIKSCDSGVAREPISTLSKSAPSFSGQRFLPPLGDVIVDTNCSTVKSSSISSGIGRGRMLRSSSFDPELIAKKPEVEVLAASIIPLQQRRKIMPGLAILGETMQQNAATARVQSGNHSWSSSSTSPGPSSNIDQDREVAAIDLLREGSSVQKCNATASIAVDIAVGRERVWKKAKGEPAAISDDAGMETANFEPAMVEQKEKKQLQEKFLALLQLDSSTSKDYKAQILDETIRYLKELRRRLNINEADSTHHERKRIPECAARGSSLADKRAGASPATSSRCQTLHTEALSGPLRLEDLELETAGVEISPHLTVESGPQIEVRMMENQHVMVNLTAKDRPGLFSDIMVVLRSLKLDIQHANIRTGNNGHRHDIFAAKMQLPFFSSQSTHTIAMALNQVITSC